MCFVCGINGSKREPPPLSVHCEAPGGGSEYESLQGRVDNWLAKAGGIKAKIPPEEGRQRSKSPTRTRSRERGEETAVDRNLDVWKLGEELATQRKDLFKASNAARKELTNKLELSKE